METISLFNGNNHRYKQELPLLFYITDYINEIALKHIKRNTGLNFKKEAWGYIAKPKTSKQIVKLLMTYDFKTEYHNNLTHKNTILLKSTHNVGFKVDCICYKCCIKNNISVKGLSKKGFLMC